MLLQLGTGDWLRRMAAAWLAAMVIVPLSAPAHAQSPAATPKPWRFAGADIRNTHAVLSPKGASQLNPRTVPNLKVKWVLNTVGDVSVTPTVEAGGLYITDWAGQAYKIDPDTGVVIWRKPLGVYAGNDYFNTYSRTSPAIGDKGEVVLGVSTAHGGTVMALNRSTGALMWKTVINPSPLTHLLGSPVIYNGKIYIGTASGEEAQTTAKTFRGAMLALDETDGHIIWEFKTVPQGYTGGAIPGSNPVIDTALNTIFVGTGNNYSIPDSVAKCVATKHKDRDAELDCMDPTNYVDAVLALDLDTGVLKWGRRMLGEDVWSVACEQNGSTCQQPRGPDSDFASAPNEFWVPGLKGRVDDRGGVATRDLLLGAGQKFGIYWAFNPATGGLFWSKNTGPASIEWGSAVDLDSGKQVYVSNGNVGRTSFTPVGRQGVATAPWAGGTIAALDTLTGNINWQVPAPGVDVQNTNLKPTADAAVSFTNYVAFQAYSSGIMAAFDVNNGKMLWSYNAGVSIEGSPAIFNDTLYWGVGYAARGGTSGKKLYAFSLQ